MREGERGEIEGERGERERKRKRGRGRGGKGDGERGGGKVVGRWDEMRPLHTHHSVSCNIPTQPSSMR